MLYTQDEEVLFISCASPLHDVLSLSAHNDLNPSYISSPLSIINTYSHLFYFVFFDISTNINLEVIVGLFSGGKPWL